MAKFAPLKAYAWPLAAAAASLVLTFNLAGCSDSGSDPNPFAMERGVVTYDYTKMVEAYGAAKVELPVEITSVSYTFRQGAAFVSSYETTIEPSTPEEIYEGVSVARTIEIPDIPTKADTVYAVYYDEAQNIVGIGVDSLKWSRTTEGHMGAQVEAPDFSYTAELGQPEILTNQVSYRPGDTIWVQVVAPYVTNAGVSVDYDLTPFYTFDTASNPYIKPAVYSGDCGPRPEKDPETGKVPEYFTPGYYETLDSYGIQPLKATPTNFPGQTETLTGQIYISDATLESVTIQSEAPEGGPAHLLVVDDALGVTEVNVEGLGMVSIGSTTVRAVGQYTSPSGRGPSFQAEASRNVRWETPESDETFSFQVDNRGRLVIVGTNNSQPASVEVAARGYEQASLTVNSYPATSSIELDMDQPSHSEIPQGTLVNGQVVCSFQVATSSATLTSGKQNVSAYPGLKVQTTGADSEGKAFIPDFRREGEQFVFDSTSAGTGSTVELQVRYEGTLPHKLTNKVTYTIGAAAPEGGGEEGGEPGGGDQQGGEGGNQEQTKDPDAP